VFYLKATSTLPILPVDPKIMTMNMPIIKVLKTPSQSTWHHPSVASAAKPLSPLAAKDSATQEHSWYFIRPPANSLASEQPARQGEKKLVTPSVPQTGCRRASGQSQAMLQSVKVLTEPSSVISPYISEDGQPSVEKVIKKAK